MHELRVSTVLRHICSDICLATRKVEHMPHGIVLSQLMPLHHLLQAIPLAARWHRPHEETKNYGTRL